MTRTKRGGTHGVGRNDKEEAAVVCGGMTGEEKDEGVPGAPTQREEMGVGDGLRGARRC